MFFRIALVLILISGSALAYPVKSSGNLYLEATKAINGSLVYGLPVLEWNIQQKPFMVDIEFRNNFTLPRGSLGVPNHHSSQLEVHLGQVWEDSYWITFSLGGRVFYEGNDDGIPTGAEGYNTLRAGISWK